MSNSLLFLFTFFLFLGTSSPLLSAYYSHNNETKNSAEYDINPGVISTTIIVDKRGRGNFTTVQQAIDAVPHNNQLWILIHVKAGIYKEKVTIMPDKQFIVLKGESRRTTVIVFKDGGPVDTSPTFKMYADNFVARDIAFVNTYNRELNRRRRRKITWAPAALIQGDKASFYRCSFISLQDTLSDLEGRHFFRSCYIEGAMDFIWGWGQSFFKLCHLNVTTSKLNPSSYIAAQGRESPSDESGFVFHTCNVLGTGPAYLGRAYRNFSRVLYYNTYMDDIVVPRGWDSWNQAGHEDLITFSEVRCHGPGSNKKRRVRWEKELEGEELNTLVSLDKFINHDGWLEKQPFFSQDNM